MKVAEPVQKTVVETIQEPATNYNGKSNGNGKPKLGSLEALRQKIKEENCSDEEVVDHPLEMNKLTKAWGLYIEQLKENKNPAWTSFELAQLNIKDSNSFEAVVNNNIHQKFLEFERNKVSEFLQKELCNRQILFTITLIEGQQENIIKDLPLSSREQYQKIIEQYPLVKELKDKLRLELDY
jgi:DNA polymerase-3 subunit gamma/tau